MNKLQYIINSFIFFLETKNEFLNLIIHIYKYYFNIKKMSLFNDINTLVENTVNKFIKNTSEKYDVSEKELTELWEKLPGKPKAKGKSKDKKSSGCVAIIATGDRKGDPCDVKISDKSETGNYCSRHLKKYEGKTGNGGNGCKAKLNSGNRKDKLCDAKVKGKGEYCARHAKLEESKSDDDNEEEEDKSEDSEEEKPKKEAKQTIKPKKSEYELPDGEHPYVEILDGLRIIFSKKSKRACGVEVVLNDKKSKMEPLTSENKAMLKKKGFETD